MALFTGGGCVRSAVETPAEARPQMVVAGQRVRVALSDPNLELPVEVAPEVREAVWRADMFVDVNRSYSVQLDYRADDPLECALVATEAGGRILGAFPFAEAGTAVVTCDAEVRAELDITPASVVVRAGHGEELSELFGIAERARAGALVAVDD